MAKAKKSNNKKVYILVGVFLLVIVVVIVALKKTSVPQQIEYQNYSTVTPTLNTYSSESLKISFSYPDDYKISELDTIITIEKENSKIFLSRVGTNFNNLEDHLNNLSKLNHFDILNREKLSINNLPTIKGNIENEKYYFIYANHLVYSLWTNSPTLFSDLDQIAQSFRYEQ